MSDNEIDNNGYVHSIFGIPVQQKIIPRPGGKSFIKAENTLNKLVGHTTEGYNIDDGFNALKGKHAGTTFLFAKHIIYQTRPIGIQSGTLEAGPGNICNQLAEIQYEMCDVSKRTLWLPKYPETLDTLATILAWANLKLNIPLVRPAGWKDDLSDTQFTLDNSRRKSGKYLDKNIPGIFMHFDVPYQTHGHWDKGAFNWTEAIRLANIKLGK